jgi:hypothetical protein
VQGELIHLLRTHGAGALPTTHCTVRRYLSPEGGEGEVQRAPQDFTSWEAIYRTLAVAFPSDRYHRGATLTDFVNGDGAVQAHIDGHGLSQGVAALQKGDEGSETDSEGRQQDMPADNPGELNARQQDRVKAQALSSLVLGSGTAGFAAAAIDHAGTVSRRPLPCPRDKGSIGLLQLHHGRSRRGKTSP